MTDWGEVFVGGIVIAVLFAISAMIIGLTMIAIDGLYNYPIAAEEAKEDCIERGFDNFDTLEKVLFTDKALGVKCKYESKYVLEDGSAIIVDKNRR